MLLLAQQPPAVSVPLDLSGVRAGPVGVARTTDTVTVTWPDDTGRAIIGVFIGAGIGFLASASVAVFSAARDTYVAPKADDQEDESA